MRQVMWPKTTIYESCDNESCDNDYRERSGSTPPSHPPVSFACSATLRISAIVCAGLGMKSRTIESPYFDFTIMLPSLKSHKFCERGLSAYSRQRNFASASLRADPVLRQNLVTIDIVDFLQPSATLYCYEGITILAVLLFQSITQRER